jgi:uncharacterized oxidoreductase
MKLNPEALRLLTASIFSGAGCRQEEARCIADHLVEANLAGYDSHGVIRAPTYVQWLNEGKVVANCDLQVVIDTDSFTVADGQRGFGQWLGKQGLDIGIRKCQEHGMAVVGLRNCGHLGRIGHWSEMAAQAGLIGLHFVNSSGFGMFVVPSGGRDPRLSVNVVSVGIPVQGRSPLILDIAAAAAAEGRLQVARNQGVPVPDGWIVDAGGNPTNDPNEFYGPPRGAILPLGGHKGYGLGLVIDLLAGALAGGGCSSGGKTQLEQSMLGIYIDPDRLDSDGRIPDEIRRYVDFVKTSRPTVPNGEVLIPGEGAERNRVERRSGLEIDDSTWSQITETARACGVDDALIKAAQMVV